MSQKTISNKMTATENQKRAQIGGEVGANGEHYKGGQFIATTDMGKMARRKANKAAAKKREIAPYVWEVAPEAGLRPIYAAYLAGTEIFDHDLGTFTFNDRIPVNHRMYEAPAVRRELIAAYNSGQRWMRP